MSSVALSLSQSSKNNYPVLCSGGDYACTLVPQHNILFYFHALHEFLGDDGKLILWSTHASEVLKVLDYSNTCVFACKISPRRTVNAVRENIL